jgi:hypothetical protein
MNGTKDTLKPTLSEKVAGIIWKILVCENNHLLAVESRDPDNKQVYFSVFNYKSGLVLLKNTTLHERWNLNMAYLTGDSLLVKVFPDEGNPVSKGVIAMSCATGKIKWEKYNISYQDVWREGLEVYNPDLLPRRSYLLDIETGHEIISRERTPEASSIILPDLRDQNIIPEWLNHQEIIGSVLHADVNGKSFLSFHEQVAGGIQLRLLVYQDDDVLINEILTEGIQKLLPEAFFIVQNHLFCIRGNNIIISYSL